MPIHQKKPKVVAPAALSTELVPKEEAEQSGPQGPQVSAIFVVFNQAEALRRAVEALERSTAREKLEILVVDCGSTDGSATLDADFPKVNILRMPHHFGATKALNIATRTAKGDQLFFLSPNVEVAPDTTERLAARLEADPDAAAASPLLTDIQGNAIPRAYALPAREELAAACKGGDLPTTTVDTSQEAVAVDYTPLDALMVRKAFVRGMNFFDERFGHYWAEADLAAQVRRAGKKIRVYPAIQAFYHVAPDPLASDPVAQVDKITGAAALLGKYGGGGFSFKLGAALGALARLNVGKFSKVLSGQKLDGSQG